MNRSIQSIRRVGALVLLSAAASVLTGAIGLRDASAFALPHLELLRSSPAADTVLTASPSGISLWFSQAPEMAATSVRLTAASGTKVPLAKPQRDTTDGAPVVATVERPLTPGKYQVVWRTMSRDGHVVKGEFGFTVSAVDSGRTR